MNMNVTNGLLNEHPRVIVYALEGMSIPERRKLISRMSEKQRIALAHNAALAVSDRIAEIRSGSSEDTRIETSDEADGLLLIVTELLDGLGVTMTMS